MVVQLENLELDLKSRKADALLLALLLSFPISAVVTKVVILTP